MATADSSVNRNLFDEQPLFVGGFELRGRSAVPRPGEMITPGGWQAALDFAESCEEASPWWIADLMHYADEQPDWRAKRSQIQAVTKLAQHTLEAMASTGRKVTGRAREAAPSLSHAAVVQALEPDEQVELLDQAKTERWTVPELRRAKKQRERTVRAEGGALTPYTVEVTVRVTREAATATQAEDQAWAAVKAAIAGVQHAHVIGAKAFPSVGPTRIVRKRKGAA